MLPDGTFCLAPPPPGIDATSYYNNMPSAVMAAPTSSSSNVGTTPTPSETVTMAPPGTAPSQITSSVASANALETRYVHVCVS